MQARNIFAGSYLDRASHLREDPDWFAAALAAPDSRVVAVWNSRSLVADGPAPQVAYLELSQLPAANRAGAELILLGRFGSRSIFAFEFAGFEAPPLPAGLRFEDLRVVAPLLSAEEAGLLGYARAMVFWRQRHRFCGVCGTTTIAGKGGHIRVCTNAACRHEVFPRIDPAIIVLISDGERALLGRQASWPEGRYSTIAGFVEPGESLEDAVAREVLEETGVQVDSIEYHSSQPWPFPSSLMLGFTAHAATTEIHLRDQELEDARWFTRAEIASGSPKVPPSISISFRLIENWFDAGGGPRLREIQGAAHWPSTR
jgi:NAD+ diphosphatase